MVLITGGAFSGLEEFAESISTTESVIYYIHNIAKEIGMKEFSLEKANDWLEEKKRSHLQLIFIHEEVGCGLIPETIEKRQLRELLGRLGCFFGERAETVYRVSCGLGIQIK